MRKNGANLSALSDEALIKEGKQVRWLSGDRKIVSTMPSAFERNGEDGIRNDQCPQLYRFVDASNRILRVAAIEAERHRLDENARRKGIPVV
jgi:hypothetical protein